MKCGPRPGFSTPAKLGNLMRKSLFQFSAHSVKILNLGALPAETPADGQDPMLLAAEYGYIEIVKLFMGDVSHLLSEEALRQGGNVLWMAATAGQMDVLNCMLNMDIPVDSHLITESLSSETMRDATPLMAATLHGHLAVVERLIASGADVNWSRGKHHPPLSMAVDESKVDWVKVDLVKACRTIFLLFRFIFVAFD